MAKAATKSNGTGKPVLVTTEFRGVFFGYLKNRDGTGDGTGSGYGDGSDVRVLA